MGVKKMRRLYTNKKGVSPVIATVLMIMVTMVGMTILFAFVDTYADSYKAGIGSAVLESLTIEDIWLSPEKSSYDNYVNVTIFNYGKLDTTISTAYANGLKLVDTSGNMNLNQEIPAGTHLTLQLKWSSNWNYNQEYTFKVSTLRGSNYEIKYTAP
jgi:flagellin-like protein